MTKVSCISFEGEETIIDAPNGMSLMEAAVKNGVAGIDADCGGACACATCHVYVDPQWSAQTGSAKATEDEMLAFVSERADNSRLACQIIISDALEGLVVRIPESQG